MLRALSLSFALFLISAGTAGAQSIRGSVRDVITGQPVPSAFVMLIDAAEDIRSATITDASGNFILKVPSTDTLRLRIQRVGYRVVESLPLGPGDAEAFHLEVGLRPEPIELEGVTATAPRNENHRRFLRRQRVGFGKYLGPEEIARRRPIRTSDLLWGMTAKMKLSRSGLGLAASANGTMVCPAVYVDGVQLEAVQSRINQRSPEVYIPIDSYVPAHAVRAVEVYRNPQQAPPEFQRAFMGFGCEVVAIWTRYGFADPD